MIKLKSYGDRVIDLEAFYHAVFNRLGDQLFSITEIDEFLFQIFRNIDVTSKKLEKNSHSLKRSCEILLKHFQILHTPKAKFQLLTSDKLIAFQPGEKDTISRFLHYVLRLDTLPARTYHGLEKKVKKDLAGITDLLTWYESHEFIQKVNTKGVSPRSHEERILFDFYKRCQAEQKEILNYYLYEMKKRALSKAFHFPAAVNAIFAWADDLKDRPYKYALPFYDPYFDCRKIDTVFHRVEDMQVDDEKKSIVLYKTDKEKFYRTFFKKNSPVSIFNAISFYLSHLPLHNDRKPLFEELKLLFNAKRWFGFYALALTQIEGLFSEMFRVAFPDKETNKKSLPDKVESVRPFYRVLVYFLDYYQYELPRLRNKFMHSGYDENLKIKSYDLLLDLLHLLKMFYEMDNPVVKIKKMHTRRNYIEFINYKDFASYFKLLLQLKPKQSKELQADIAQFEKEFLHKYCNVEYVCVEVNQNLPVAFSDFNERFMKYSTRVGDKINFETMVRKDISFVLRDESITDEIDTSFRIAADSIEDLNDYRVFLLNYKSYLPSLSPEISAMLSELAKKYLPSLNAVNAASEKIKLLNSQTSDFEVSL